MPKTSHQLTFPLSNEREMSITVPVTMSPREWDLMMGFLVTLRPVIIETPQQKVIETT